MIAYLFYLCAAVAVVSAVLAVTRLNASHALLFMVVLLLSLALIFYLLGAPFAAALTVIVYAGAIVVLLLFAVMLLNLGRESVAGERRLLAPRVWILPAVLAAILLAELVFLLRLAPARELRGPVGLKAVGLALFGPYLLGVELASFLLLAGLISAVHLGRRLTRGEEEGGGQ